MITEELKERIKNMLRKSDHMLGRVVDEVMRDENAGTGLHYDIIADCQCRKPDGTFLESWKKEHYETNEN